jgi:hypothetical protein
MYIAKVKVLQTPKLNVPFLAFKNVNEHSVYTLDIENGNVQYLNSVDIENSEKYGYTYEIIDVYYWRGKEKIFNSFYTKLYNYRVNNTKDNKAMNQIIKLVSNGSIGKFNQKEIYNKIGILTLDNIVAIEKLYSMDVLDCLNNGKIKPIRFTDNLNYLIYEYTDFRAMNRLDVLSKCRHISSFMYSYARWKLNDVFIALDHHRLGSKSIFYCDTDNVYTLNSTISNNLAFKSLCDNTQLGKLKFEGYSNNEYVTIEPKTVIYYFFDRKKYCLLHLNRQTNNKTGEVSYNFTTKIRFAGANIKELSIKDYINTYNNDETATFKEFGIIRYIMRYDGKFGLYSYIKSKNFSRKDRNLRIEYKSKKIKKKKPGEAEKIYNVNNTIIGKI